MSQFDVAVGMDAATLNQGIAGLYARPDAREKLFKGTQTGAMGTRQYTAQWDAQAAPRFVLEPPPADRWAASIDATGKHPAGAAPAQNAFQLHFPTFSAQYTMGGTPVSGTTEVVVFATASITASVLTVVPAAVWLDETHMTGWDRFILNGVILKQVLARATEMLAALRIDPIGFSVVPGTPAVELDAPVVSISGGRLVLAARLKGTGAVDLSGTAWPPDPLFVLLSAGFLTQVASGLTSQLQGKEFSDSGTAEKVLSYEYTARVASVSGITPRPDDLTKITASVGLAFDATLKPLGVGGPCAMGAATGAL